jgi:signal transduction histidine kinase
MKRIFTALDHARQRHLTGAWGLAMAALLALLISAVNETAYRDASQAIVGLGQRGVARVQLQSLLRRLIDAETAQRGYLLTGRSEYLAPYQQSVKDVDEALAWLRQYYAGDPRPSGVLDDITARSHEKMSEVATSISLYDAGRTEAWRGLLLTDIGREKMEAIRNLSQTLVEIETGRVTDDRRALFDTLQLSRVGMHLLTVAGLIGLFLFLRQVRRLAVQEREAAAALQAERDHLEAEVARRTADLTELARHLQTAREDERARLARELHDELGALLTAAKLDAARLKRSLQPLAPETETRLAHLNATINDGIGLKRRIIEDLRPSSLANLGLAEALDILAREFAQRSEIPVQTELEPLRLAGDGPITTYRLVQESLTNIAKYAAATQVTVRLQRDGARAQVSVRDNGRGFDTAAQRGSAMGLVGMRYRVESQGGVMEVISAKGQGTTVRAWLPVDDEDMAAGPPA